MSVYIAVSGNDHINPLYCKFQATIIQFSYVSSFICTTSISYSLY